MEPYSENKDGNIIRRTFSKNVSDKELTWHRDHEDRIVIPINENDWYVQFDNELPKKLNVDEEFFIPKNTFHRVIKGSSDLMVEIIETTFDDLEVYEVIEEGKNKKKKKDACYYKVRSRYDVWPSAYASGALVKCRKVGAKNWGNKTDENEENIDEAKKTDFSKEKEQGLHGWFARQGGSGKSKGWVDCNTCKKDPKTGRKKCKSCGRKEGEKRKYPACRPTPSACGTRGKGKKWGKKTNEDLNISENISTFDTKYLKMRLHETFNQNDAEPMIQPQIKPKVEPKPNEVKPNISPSRRNKPFLPMPEVTPDPKAISEGSDTYQVYHNTFSSAVQTALQYAESKGYTINEDEWFDTVSVGPKRPSEGQTNRYSISLYKDGVIQRKALHIQVYGMGDKYELNAYIA